MKYHLLLIALSLFLLPANAQKTMNNTSQNAAMQAIEDRIAIKNVVDTFSVLADQKDVATQMTLFTEDATVESVVNGAAGTALKGRKQIGDAFAAYLNMFQTVYHINGQQTLTLNGDKASGISYCAVTLIGVENGKTMRTEFGIYYNDDYVKQNGRWLIAKRVSHFVWQDKHELGK